MIGTNPGPPESLVINNCCRFDMLVIATINMGIGLNSLEYGVLYLGSHYSTGPYINFPHFGNRNLGKLPHYSNDGFCYHYSN